MDKLMAVIKQVCYSACKAVSPTINKQMEKYCPRFGVTVHNIASHVKDRKGRVMLFPYTHTAKLVQFPYRWHFENGWTIKYYTYAILICIPFMHKISKGVNTKENKEEWKKIREEWYGKHSYHG